MANEDFITSHHNPKIKLAAKLREARQRKKMGLTLIDGRREIAYAIRAGVKLEQLFLRAHGPCGDDAASRSFDRSQFARPELLVEEVPTAQVIDSVLDKIAFGDRRTEAVAIARIPSRQLASLSLPSNGLVLVAHRIEKPGNLGAIARSADATGVDAVLMSQLLCDPYNPNAIRASQGTIFSFPLATGSTQEIRELLVAKGYRILTACVDASTDYWDANLTGPVAIVVGNEASGLGSDWTSDDVEEVRLPMRGVADSLNVSVAAAALLFEAARQRHRS